MDRIEKIKSINEQYNLLENSYISFSGGKDSTVLSALIDEALPDNKIPRLFLNTGIEYKEIFNFVKQKSFFDSRIKIINSGVDIKKMLMKNGYPFKSKEHAQKVAIFQKSGYTKTVLNYIGKGEKKDFLCPEKLVYQFNDNFKIKISDKCCFYLKKNVAENWSEKIKKPIAITGVRKNEKGLRQSMGGCLTFDKNKIKKFHPLFPVENKWVDWFIQTKKIELCKLYYAPFNFKRTGCKGCPFSVDLQNQLDTMAIFFPKERRQCENIWGEVYKEMRKINYRLSEQITLFEV